MYILDVTVNRCFVMCCILFCVFFFLGKKKKKGTKKKKGYKWKRLATGMDQ